MSKRKVTLSAMSYVLELSFCYNDIGIIKEKCLLIGDAMVLLIEIVCNDL